MTLAQWYKNAWLEPHQTTQAEVRAWVRKIDREIKDASTTGLSVDGKYLHAYNAALLIATASLAAAGYRPERRDSHHYRAFQSLELTLGLPASDLSLLDSLRKNAI